MRFGTCFLVLRSSQSDLKVMSLHKYFQPASGNKSVDSVPVVATIANLTYTKQHEVDRAIRSSGENPLNPACGSGKKSYGKYGAHLQ